MRRLLSAGVLCCGLSLAVPGEAQTAAAGTTRAPAAPATLTPLQAELLSVKRIYVGELTGGLQAEALRELIISSLNSTKLFILTDNPDRADAVLKGAADDHAFVDTFDVQDGISGRVGTGSGSSSYTRSSGSYGGVSIGDQESRHTRERKHEAYAAVRLCGRDGDVLWATTEESQGGKFRGASADVATRVARDLTFAMERAEKAANAAETTGSAAPGR